MVEEMWGGLRTAPFPTSLIYGKGQKMKELTINGKDYKLEFSFDAAERKDFVSMMFRQVSGAAIIGNAKDIENPTAAEMIDGSINMISDLPHVCITGFYVGLLENNPVEKDEAKSLMKSYMKEKKIGFLDLYDELKQCMEDDGFFELSGIKKMLERMQENQQEQAVKIPQDHKRKSTGTK